MKIVTFTSIILFIFASCTNNSDVSVNKQPTFQVSIEGDNNQQLKIQGDCSNLFANYLDFTDQGLPGTKSLVIEGRDDHNRLIGLTLYFNSLPSDGIFHLGVDDNTLNNGGWGQFIPDYANALLTFYSTDDKNTGKCTILEYNQKNQTISGTFDFTGQKKNYGMNVDGVVDHFIGSFTNVPINDMTDPTNPKGPCHGTMGNPLGNNGNTGNGGGTGQNSTITFTNPTFTPIDITFNGNTKTAPVGGSAVFSGSANTTSTGNASTSGKTNTNTLVGALITWDNITQAFPSSGNNINYQLNVGSNFFFLKMKNTSNFSLLKIYVNYNLQNQTLDNVTIPNDGNTYNLGYYRAFSNSNVRAESGNYYWSWSSLSLSNVNNQSTTLTAN